MADVPQIFNVSLYDTATGASKITNCISVDDKIGPDDLLSNIRDLLAKDKKLDSGK